MTPVAIPGTVIRPHASPTYLPSGKRGFLTRPNSMVMVAVRVLPVLRVEGFPPLISSLELWGVSRVSRAASCACPPSVP